ncbi:MAG: MauE/DoxX family redox-associated membrane protein [Ginsengibacter sp.]
MMKYRNVIIEIICGLLALLFAYAALSKLLDYKAFHAQIIHSPVTRLLSSTIWILPFAEIIIALLLTFSGTRKYGLYTSLVLLSVFTSYIIYMLVFAKHLPCSCGGVLKQLSWRQHIWFNAFFLLVAATGIVLERKQNLSSIRVR